MRHTPNSTTTLAAAIRNRKATDTPVPISPPTSFMASNRSCSAAVVAAMSSDSPTTTVEWPSENHRPTDSGRWPSSISLRVTLSMAAMWSASKAWRSPNV